MEKSRVKKLDISKIDPKKATRAAVIIVLIVLLGLLYMSNVIRSNIQNDYASARNEVGEALYTELYMFCQTFDQITVPGAEIQDVIIPGMHDYFLAAQALNSVLSNGFGERYAVLSPENLSALSAAFDAYDSAFRAGRSTDEAQTSMQNCVEMLRGLLSQRYPSGILAPR